LHVKTVIAALGDHFTLAEAALCARGNCVSVAALSMLGFFFLTLLSYNALRYLDRRKQRRRTDERPRALAINADTDDAASLRDDDRGVTG